MSSNSGEGRQLQKPATVSIAELTIAAGMAGHSIALCFDAFPASVLCALWSNLTRGLDANTVLQVNGRADLRKLERNIDDIRLAIVHNPKLYLETNWAINIKSRTDSAQAPAVFANCLPDDLNDDPAATLILSVSAAESNAISTWLASSNQTSVAWSRIQEILSRSSGRQAFATDFEESLELRTTLSSLQDLQVVRGFLAGASLLRSTKAPEQSERLLGVTAEDYKYVRSLLVSHAINAGDRPVDQLATTMVDRANVYLEVKNGGNWLSLSELPDEPVRTAKSEPITRLEIADLGNTSSRLMKNLVESLKQVPDGRSGFIRMGLIGRPPAQGTWTRQSSESLCALLRTWSPKQVRSHFSRLQAEGLITANRQSNNGAWLYRLPESLAAATSCFANLPSD